MPTIVEYTSTKRPLNAYPARIISPPAPRACCQRGMVPISEVHVEEEWRFVYQRCPTCGFTVRHFMPVPAWIDLEGIFGINGRDGRQMAG